MDTNDVENKILQVIRIGGPVIPNKIAKAIESNILMASAHLSELSSRGLILVTNVKNDSSPFYYLKGQEEKLQQLSKYLNEKDQKAFNLLKDKGILRDRELEPLVRVGMRAIKDFAVPLQVKTKEGTEIFWKWYLLNNEEASRLIKGLINPESKKIEEEKKDKEEQIKKVEEERKKREKEFKNKLEKEKIKRKKIEKEKPEKKKAEEQKKLEQKKEVVVKRRELKPDIFLEQLNRYFTNKGIEVLECEVVRKNAEIDLILRVPSAVGNVDYFCKAKNKKRVGDGDLSSAFLKGQMKKLPILFLTTGDLTKRANEMLGRELNNGVVFKKI